MTFILQLERVRKAFGGLVANKDVTLRMMSLDSKRIDVLASISTRAVLPLLAR